MAVAALGVGVVAMACHGLDKHIESIHPYPGGPWNENVCIDLETNDLTFKTARNWVKYALYDNGTDPVPGDWESLSNVFFEISGSDCDDLGAFRDDYEIEFEIRDDYQPNCPSTSVACTDYREDDSYWYEHLDHRNYRKVFIYIKDDDLLGSLNVAIINHETGHALGLADPKEGNGGASWEYCERNWGLAKQWVESIMHHALRCPVPGAVTRSWPSTYDLASMETIGSGFP